MIYAIVTINEAYDGAEFDSKIRVKGRTLLSIAKQAEEIAKNFRGDEGELNDDGYYECEGFWISVGNITEISKETYKALQGIITEL